MPRGPNVATSLCTVSNAKQGLSYFCMWACCPFLKRLARLSGQLARLCMIQTLSIYQPDFEPLFVCAVLMC